MFIMDFKGITWAGNVYQKFEAMCLEVEEAVCQDTIKFVENQAQTVGSSVKKFYSDVVQDLLPPYSVDSVKLATADIYMNPYADFGICKKPKASIKNDTIRKDKKFSEDLAVISSVNTNYSSSFSGHRDVYHFQPPYSMGPVTGTGLELCLEQNEHRGAYKRRSRRFNYRPSEIPRSIAPMTKDMSKLSSDTEITENHGVPCGQIDMISSPPAVDITGCHSSGVKSRANISGSSTVSAAGDTIGTPTPHMSLPIGPVLNNETELRCNTLIGGPDALAAELNGTCSNSGMVHPIGSYISGDRQDSEKASETRLSPTGGCNLDGNENGNVLIEAGFETCSKPWDNSKLEETCVLVDAQEICPTAHGKDKPRSYKKKIWKTLSSKRSTRMQEYEQLAVQHGDIEAKSTHESAKTLMLTFTMEADTKKSPQHGDNESEWELL